MCLTRVSVRDPLVLSSLLEAGRSLSIAKLKCFNLKMTTAVNCYGNVGSWQSVGQDEVSVDVDRGRLFFSCCLRVWRPVLIEHHVVIRGNLTFSETDGNIPSQANAAGDGNVEDD